MSNIYWPVYQNLEKSVEKVAFSIHIDDNQLNVYSSLITDIILRAAAEIESISKELYQKNGGTKTDHVKFDHDAIKHLNKLWKLDKKNVVISSIYCFQSNKILVPFIKDTKNTITSKITFSWNNAYQNLKHDRGNSIEYGSVKYMFDIMSALFILNLYYKNEDFDLDNHSKAENFDLSLGSRLFSIKLHKWFSYNRNNIYKKRDDFDECIYYSRQTQESLTAFNSKANDLMQKNAEISREILIKEFLKNPNDFIELQKLNNTPSIGDVISVIGSNRYNQITKDTMQQAAHQITGLNEAFKGIYECVLNKNDSDSFVVES